MNSVLRWGMVVAFLFLAGVLIYIAVPDRARGRQVTCVSNLYSLAGAVEMYIVDCGRLPPAARWVEATREYRGDHPDQLRCPEDKSGARCSYGMNQALDGKAADEISLDPSKLVLFYETAHPGDNPVGGASDVVSPPRHPDGNNYGYVTGYATVSLKAPSFDPGPPPPQPRPSHAGRPGTPPARGATRRSPR